MKCALCDEKECYQGKDCTKIGDVGSRYKGEKKRTMETAAHVEANHYMKSTRIEEVMIFAERMGYKHLGIGFCIGLSEEARVLHLALEGRGFKVSSVCCKVCGLDKKDFGLERLHDEEGIEATCNPIGQAEVLNKDGTELNLLMGLCVGHDILFTQACKAPVTTIVVKDRVMAHNPVGVIYSRYHRKRTLGLTE
jgi:uncharacterized metal-binding protein